MKIRKAQAFFFTILAIVISKEKGNTYSTIASKGKNESFDSPADVEQTVSRSYVQKFSQSWKFFAKANDISKREKLKKALADALNSIEYKKRNDISVNINNDAVSRIKHAAQLLKEFREMYSLSDKVKKTLKEYSKAKQDLVSIASNETNISILKSFLDLRRHKDSKRTNIPYGYSIRLHNPEYLKKTDKIALKAIPLDESGKIGLEFSSIDSRTSSIDRAMKAFNAAKIILDFASPNRERIKSLTLRNMISSNNKQKGFIPELTENSNKRSEFPQPVNNTQVKNSSGDSEASAKNTNETYSDVTLNQTISNQTVETRSSSEIVNAKNDLSKKIKPFVRLLKKIGVRNFLKKMSSMDNTQERVYTTQTEASKKNLTLDDSAESVNDVTTTKSQEDNIEMLNQTVHDEELLKKQKITVARLKEAKLARQKYEIAKHELAEKIKELYQLANDFEKDESQDQFLEVKKSSASTPVTEIFNVEPRFKHEDIKSASIKRSDNHPGIALTGILHKSISVLNTDTSSDNNHKGLTMGMIDKAAHQVKLDDVKTATDVHGHLDVKINTSGDQIKDGNPEETFKHIVQAIDEDINEISKDDLKTKSLLAVASSRTPIKAKQNKNVVLMVTNSSNKDSLSNEHITENIDDFLTKALSDIISNSSSAQGKDFLIKSKGVEPSKQNEKNRKIVEKAMKAHAANPYVELPLLKKNGDAIIPNKDAQTVNKKEGEKSNQVIFSNSIFNNPLQIKESKSAQSVSSTNLEEQNLLKLVEDDPNNKALLEKASHMEEQVAAAQERLFSTLDNPPTKVTSLSIDSSPNLLKEDAPSTSNEIFPQSSTLPDLSEAKNTLHLTSRPLHISTSHAFFKSNNQQPKSYLKTDKDDPYSSIKEQELPPYETSLRSHSLPDEDTPEEDEDDEDEDEEDHYRPSTRRHHHHYMPESDEDDDRNEDDEYDDDDPRYEDKRKRTLLTGQIPVSTNRTVPDINYNNYFSSLNYVSSPHEAMDFPEDNLEDALQDETKKSIIFGSKNTPRFLMTKNRS